jgi:hypothetical protein
VLAIDHVIVVVDDLGAAARRYDEVFGLASVTGGRHPGHGTGNRIVPLGSSYLELVAVVDEEEAAESPFGRWVERLATGGRDAPAALCLRTDDIDAAARRTGCDALAMSRTRPDGVVLEWEVVGLELAIADGLPFFIQWHVDEGDHPGRDRVEHRRDPVGIDWVELGADASRLHAWLGDHDLPLRMVDGAAGPHRVAVAMVDGEAVVLG